MSGVISEVMLAVYDLSIANAPISPQDARLTVDGVGRSVGKVREATKQVLMILESIDTVKLAAKGLYDEAAAVGKARVALDRMLEAGKGEGE